MTNNEIANLLQDRARTLRREHRNLYRVKAYRHAAEMVMRLNQPVEELLHEKGPIALAEVPGIGKRLAKTIAHYLETGEWPTSN